MQLTKNITPLVSVVMPNHEGARFVREAVASVLAQTHTNFELIVLDDASTDESWHILKDMESRDTRIRIMHNTHNRGIAAVRNLLLKEVSADARYIAILDSDDIMEPTRLEEQVAYLEAHPATGMVGSWVTLIDEDGIGSAIRKYPHDSKEIQRTLLCTNPIAQSAAMLRTEVITEVGAYDERLSRVSDLDYWARVIKEGYSIANMPEALIKYRIHKPEGRFMRSRQHLWFGFVVRMRHVMHPKFFSLRAFAIAFGHLFASILPQSIVRVVTRRYFRTHEHTT